MSPSCFKDVSPCEEVLRVRHERNRHHIPVDCDQLVWFLGANRIFQQDRLEGEQDRRSSTV